MTTIPDPEAGTVHDAPNQQVVRPDASAPWEEGDGGSWHPEGTPTSEPEAKTTGADDDSLDELTKDELIEEASRRGVDVSTAMNKDEIKAAIRAG